MEENRRRELAELPLEELERRLRETFFYTDKIDETVYLELEQLREALEAKQPMEYAHTAEESWALFLEAHGGDLAPEPRVRQRSGIAERRRRRAFLRGVLIAAAVLVLLAGTALAADSLGLVAWVPQWNRTIGQYEPVALEGVSERPIPEALRELGITEPVYPGWLPEGFTLTESRISKDPLVLIEQYAREDQRLSITVTPIKGFKNAVYQAEGGASTKVDSGSGVHYLFKNAGTITGVWYTKHYATSVSGDITVEELRRIIGSLYGEPD